MTSEKEILLDSKIYNNNEIDANKSLAKGCFVTGIILIVVWLLYLTDVFAVESRTKLIINISFPILIVILTSSILYMKTSLVEKKWFKYVLVYQYLLAVFALNVLIPKHTVLMWAVCIIIVNNYYNPKILLITFISVSIFMLFGIYLGALIGEWDSNLLNGTGDIVINGKTIFCEKTTIKDRIDWMNQLKDNGDNRYLKIFLFYYLGRMLCLTIVFLVTLGLARRSYKMLKLEVVSQRSKQKLQSEFAMASGIQKAILPKPFDKTNGEDIFGIMNAAKEIGGDFYDYFYVDDNHLALVIADVSGKGVPAALFMMKTETLVMSLTQSFKRDTAKIMQRINVALCNNNDINMFVTCWLGILNLSNGELAYTNAGHNSPIIIHNNETKYLLSNKELVLGALLDANYTENKIKLTKGDKIILYTDGVTEAHNLEDKLYGDDRLLKFIEVNKDLNVKDLVSNLREDINVFENGREQFDDITILGFEFIKEASIVGSKIFKADIKELDNLFEYSSSLLRMLEFSNKDIIMINTALEEVFVNVAHYAYEGDGTVEVSLSNDKNSVIFTFKDSGKPFNPLLREDPNITASSDEREIGGLGIYMVKKIMDEVHYKYEKPYNVLTLIKYRK